MRWKLNGANTFLSEKSYSTKIKRANISYTQKKLRENFPIYGTPRVGVAISRASWPLETMVGKNFLWLILCIFSHSKAIYPPFVYL